MQKWPTCCSSRPRLYYSSHEQPAQGGHSKSLALSRCRAVNAREMASGKFASAAATQKLACYCCPKVLLAITVYFPRFLVAVSVMLVGTLFLADTVAGPRRTTKGVGDRPPILMDHLRSKPLTPALCGSDRVSVRVSVFLCQSLDLPLSLSHSLFIVVVGQLLRPWWVTLS